MNESPEHNDFTKGVSSSSNKLNCLIWADIPSKIPLASLERLDGTPSLEPPPSRGYAVSGASSRMSSAQNANSVSYGNLKTIAGKQPYASCSEITSPASGSPAADRSPTVEPTPPVAPAMPFKTPFWAEPKSMAGMHRAAAVSISAGTVVVPIKGPAQLATAAAPPNTLLQQALLLRMQHTSKACKLQRGCAQRNNVSSSMVADNYAFMCSVRNPQQTI